MATIRVNTTVMRDKAQSLVSISNSIRNFVDEMNKEVDGMRSFWEGEAAESTIKEYHRLATGFEDIYATIEKYSEFLNTAADGYDNVQTSNTI